MCHRKGSRAWGYDRFHKILRLLIDGRGGKGKGRGRGKGGRGNGERKWRKRGGAKGREETQPSIKID